MTAAEFYLNTPLYTPCSISSIQELRSIVDNDHFSSFDGYNPLSQIDTTYTLDRNYYYDISDSAGKYMTLTLTCLRSREKFTFHAYWDHERGNLIKTGQFPSVASFHIQQVKQYDKLLEKSDLKEFTRAIGLAANGVGIGSFVYLRRIFENLIYTSVEEMKSKEKFDEMAFNRLRMAERIDYLKNYLPAFLVDHKELYSILSLGIHELTEEDCLQHFDVVKAGIEFILDEKLEKYNREKKMMEASEKIKATASTIKKN